MNAPEAFVKRLSREFDNRLRIRWSNARGEWQIEQKVGRGVLPPAFVSETDDDLIRARDGYGLVMTIRTGDRMPCPVCGIEIKVPVLRSAEATCDYCRLRGKDGRYLAAHYPLDGDLLINRLKELDPQRTYRDGIARLMDAKNKAIEAAREKDFSNLSESIVKDNLNQLFQVPSVGYTGREKAWER